MSEMKTQQARVLVAHSDHGVAMNEAGQLIEFSLNRSTGRPLAGDWVDLDASARMSKIHERQTLFGRGDHKGLFKPTAANLDQLMIVIAPQPAPSLDLITRYLVMAELHGIRPLIVVNKKDLGIPTTPPFTDLPDLIQLGYLVTQTSKDDEASLEALDQMVTGHTTLLAGQSGVGKSSLLNRLIPSLDALTGQLSKATGKGKHTTTTTRLYPLPQGGFLVDSPGVWEYGLWTIPTQALASAFIEFRPYIGQCKFRDCTHDHEPGCAIRCAVDAGEIAPSRHAAWRRLLAEQQRYNST